MRKRYAIGLGVLLGSGATVGGAALWTSTALAAVDREPPSFCLHARDQARMASGTFSRQSQDWMVVRAMVGPGLSPPRLEWRLRGVALHTTYVSLWREEARGARFDRLVKRMRVCSRGVPVKQVLSEDFENGGGDVAKALLRDPRLTIVPGEGVNGSAALRAAYVGGQMGSERLVRAIALGERGNAYTLSYDVKFDRDFQFVRGGKLHGLGPDKSVTGGDPIRPDGWSARVMWREEGRPELYTYHQDQKGQYGDHGVVAATMRFETGRWYAVSLQVKLNDPASAANGSARLYVDGTLIEAHENVRLRGQDGPDTQISKFLFSTFHGGNDPSWAPLTPTGGFATVHAWFDNFEVDGGAKVRKAPGM